MVLLHLALAFAGEAADDVPGDDVPADEVPAEYFEPRMGKALLLSTVAGFGTGHFYARQPVRAIPPLALQAAGLGLAVAGVVESRTDEHAGGQLSSLGLSLLVVGRGLDILMTPGSVKRTVEGDLYVPRVQLFWDPG